jgi:hypothetical protein
MQSFCKLFWLDSGYHGAGPDGPEDGHRKRYAKLVASSLVYFQNSSFLHFPIGHTGSQPDASASEAAEAKYAKKILPFRRRGSLLLCTLLFGNVAVNSMVHTSPLIPASIFYDDYRSDPKFALLQLSILMADLTSGLAGFLISAFAITLFGEIVPQAVILILC